MEARRCRDARLDKIIVKGGQTLSGEVRISGAKNAVLPIIVSTLLTEEPCTLLDVPRLADVETIKEVLQSLGVQASVEGHTMLLDAGGVVRTDAPYEYVQKMRASVLVMGPLLARFGSVRLSLPGGCAIGTRPIDIHLKGLELLGASIHIGSDEIVAESKGPLQGADIYLRVPSVGATENLMMAASLAKGTTLIENAAEEPEIVDLANMLNEMGADVRGAGTKMIRINGVRRLHGNTHTIIPDRIEAGSYLLAGAITASHIRVSNCIADHLGPVIEKICESGAKIVVDEDAMTVDVYGQKDILPVDITTMPYPGFPTDMQSQFMAYMSLAKGSSLFTENIFENRFMHVDELRKLGANIHVDGRSAFVNGVPRLYGAEVNATDLRAGAALLIAALAADGESHIGELFHIDRGYEDLIGKFKQLGAHIERIYVDD